MNKKNFNYGLRTSIIYWVVSIIWIFTSDSVLGIFAEDIRKFSKFQTIKGFVFVTASAILIYVLFEYYFSKSRLIQEKLIESEEKFREVFETANVGKSITSLNGEINVNQAFAEMLGYKKEELIKRTWQSLTPAEEIETIQKKLEELTSGGINATRYTKRYIHKDSSILWADVSVSIMRDKKGNPLHFITTIVDITAQKHAEQALLHSHDLLGYIIEHNRSAVAVHDKDLNYIYVSKRYLDEYNIKEKDVIGKHHYEIFPDLPQKWRDVHQRALAGEVVSAEDDPYYRDDGTVEWTRWECRPWFERDNTIGGIIVYTEVITQRMEMEKALRESEERLRLAVNSAQQGIYDINIETGEVIVNDIYATMLGETPETFKITVEGWMNRLHPDDYDFVTQYFNEYISGKHDEYKLEYRLRTATGEYIWILSLGSIVQRDERGKPLRMLGTHTDITARKNAEREKLLFNHILEESLNEIFIFNEKSLKFIQANKAAISNLGYSMEELLKMTPLDIKPQVTFEEFSELIAPLREGIKKQVNFETLHQRKDGSTYEVEVHLQLQKMGNESLFTAIILDISERKKNEKIIFEERQRLASIIEGANVGTWEWSIPTGQILINDRWARMVGYSLEELQPTSIETWKALTHPNDLILAEEKLQEHFSKKLDYYDVEIRMRHKDGHWVWVQDHGQVSEWTKDGNPLMMQGTHHDITLRKESEEKIMQQLDELRRWHDITLGREDRIIELKQEINKLLKESGKPPRYESVTTPDE